MNKLRTLHPATMYLLLTVAVIVLSWLAEVYGLSIVQDGTGEALRVQSLLSPEGIRWLLRHVVTNFTCFAPLGWVVIALFGIGVAVHSGFVEACWKLLTAPLNPPKGGTSRMYLIRFIRHIRFIKDIESPPFGGIEGGFLSFKQRRALLAAFAAVVPYALLVWFTACSSWAILRGVDGGLSRSPFMSGLPFLLSLGVGLMGMVYGFAAGRYRTDADVVDGLLHFARLLGLYVVIAFFASQMFACMDYSRLSLCFPVSAPFSVIRFFTLFMPYMPLVQTLTLLYAPQTLCTAILRYTWWLTLVWALFVIVFTLMS